MTPQKFAAILIALPLALGNCKAAVLVVDSFDEGPFAYSIDPGPGGDTQSLPVLGGSRLISVSTNRRDTNVTATLLDGSGGVVFDTGDGPAAVNSQQGSLFMRWSGMVISGPVNLLGYDAFVISIPAIQGSGWVRVGVNKQTVGTTDTFLPVSQPGDLIVPFSSVDTGSIGFERVTSIHVVLTGSTPDFGATIAGVTIVPEPHLGALLSVSLLVISRRRYHNANKSE